MAKRGPIGKVESFYIEQHLSSMSVEDIALDLDRSVASVTAYMKKNKIKAESPKTMIDQHIVRHKGGAVMTENASSLSDSHRRSENKPRPSCITNIK
jgi:hypothetical protein